MLASCPVGATLPAERLIQRLRTAQGAGRGGWHTALDILIVAYALALLTRLVGLDLTITADEGYWMHRSIRFAAALGRGDLASTYRSGHPGVTVMWVGLLGIGPQHLAPFATPQYVTLVTMESSPGYLEMLARARLAMAIATSVLFAVAIALAWRLLGPGPAFVGGALLLLNPYLVGASRLLHVDALLGPLMTVSALAGLVYWTRERRWPYLALAAATGGLALLTKAPAVALGPFFVLLALALGRPRRGSWRRTLLAVVAWGLIAALVYVAVWPALWVDPLHYLQRVARFVVSVGGQPHYPWPNFFLGQVTYDDPGPLFYPVALAYRLGPITLLGLLVLPLALRRPPSHRPAVLGVLGYVLLFVALMTLGGKKFDRYMLPAIPALDLLAGAGLWALAGWGAAAWPRDGRTEGRRDRASLSVSPSLRPSVPPSLLPPLALLLVQATILGRSYPYPLAAYNPLLGGVDGASRAIVVGWGEGVEQAAAYLNDLPLGQRGNAMTLYGHVLRPRLRWATLRMDESLLNGPSTEEEAAEEAFPLDPANVDFFVLTANMAQRDLIPPFARLAVEDGQPEFVGRVHGTDFVWVYRLPKPAAG